MPSFQPPEEHYLFLDSDKLQNISNDTFFLPMSFHIVVTHQVCQYANIAKDLLPTANEEVYPLYAIKDWNEISLHWVETFYQKENVRGMLNNFVVSGLEEYSWFVSDRLC